MNNDVLPTAKLLQNICWCLMFANQPFVSVGFQTYASGKAHKFGDRPIFNVTVTAIQMKKETHHQQNVCSLEAVDLPA